MKILTLIVSLMVFFAVWLVANWPKEYKGDKKKRHDRFIKNYL